MEKMIGWMPRVWLKNGLNNAKLQKMGMLGVGQILSFESSVSIIVTLMTSEQRSLKSMKSNVSLQLVVIYIFLLSFLHKLSSLCVFVSNTSRGEKKCGNSNEAACPILDSRHVVSLWGGWGRFGEGGKNWGVFSGAGCAAVWQSGGWLGLVGRAVVDREVIADAGL